MFKINDHKIAPFTKTYVETNLGTFNCQRIGAFIPFRSLREPALLINKGLSIKGR